MLILLKINIIRGFNFKRHIFTILLFLPFIALSQNNNKNLLQLSGIVVTITKDTILPVPYAHVYVKATKRGTVANYYGYFSMVVENHDTIIFSAVGYKKTTFTISADSIIKIDITDLSTVQVLEKDTIYLKEVVIYPWQNIDEFKKIFVNTNPPDDDLQRAKRNLNLLAMKQLAEEMGMDGTENQRYFMQQESYKSYYAGQIPPMGILSPLAWAEFFDAINKGKFKRKKKKDD